MKKVSVLLFAILLLFTGCKKDTVDASNTKAFESSINDMASGLNTIQQIKFNEALYILKKFAVEGSDDVSELKNLGKLLNGKKVPEIMAMADQVAQKNGIAWTSTGPPSLGEMNIFGNEKASENDPNDVPAKGLTISANPIKSTDSTVGTKALQIVPRLVDGKGQPITFSGAGLETIMEVSSGGARIYTSRNMMQDNNFHGFTLRFASLPKDKIINDEVEIKITVKTSKTTLQMIKSSIPVNPNALLVPVAKSDTADDQTEKISDEDKTDPETPKETEKTEPSADPKATVSKFLNNLSSQNLKAAYDTADNPAWGSYDKFASPNSGFGAVQALNVKTMHAGGTADHPTVKATYDVTDKQGQNTTLNVTFGLKNVGGQWKIASYKIN